MLLAVCRNFKTSAERFSFRTACLLNVFPYLPLPIGLTTVWRKLQRSGAPRTDPEYYSKCSFEEFVYANDAIWYRHLNQHLNQRYFERGVYKNRRFSSGYKSWLLHRCELGLGVWVASAHEDAGEYPNGQVWFGAYECPSRWDQASEGSPRALIRSVIDANEGEFATSQALPYAVVGQRLRKAKAVVALHQNVCDTSSSRSEANLSCHLGPTFQTPHGRSMTLHCHLKK